MSSPGGRGSPCFERISCEEARLLVVVVGTGSGRLRPLSVILIGDIDGGGGGGGSLEGTGGGRGGRGGSLWGGLWVGE